MTNPNRIADLEADRDFWNRLQGEMSERFDELISLQGNNVSWPNSKGGDDLDDAIQELDEAVIEIARHRTGAQARLDWARADKGN